MKCRILKNKNGYCAQYIDYIPYEDGRIMKYAATWKDLIHDGLNYFESENLAENALREFAKERLNGEGVLVKEFEI